MYSSLFLNRLLVHPSEKEINVTFRKGLNIILAEDAGVEGIQTRNSVGKSTFIDLIDYGLGREIFLSNDKKAAKTRMEKMNLYLEFSINKIRYTVQRNLVNCDFILIYENWVIDDLLKGLEITPEIKEVKDYCSFLESELFKGTNIFKKKRIISWRQIASILIRDQVGGFQDLAQPANYNERAQIKRKRLDFLLNLLTPQKSELDLEHVTATEKAIDAQKSYNVILKYAKHKLKVTEIELQSKIIEVKHEITNKGETLLEYKDQLINLDKSHEIDSQRRSKLVQELIQLGQEIDTHQYRIKNYEATINEIHGELQKIDLAQSATYFLNRYDYKQCPTCLRPFSLSDTEDCSHTVSQVSDGSVQLIKTVLTNERLELIDATGLHIIEINRLDKNRQEIQRTIDLINIDLNKDAKSIIEKINNKEIELNALQMELNNLTNLSILNSDVDSYNLDWQNAKEKLSEVNKSIITVQQEIDKRLTSFKQLVNEVVEFLYNYSRVGLLKRSSKAGNLSLDIKHKGESDGIDDGAASYTIRVIAFDLALLKLAVLHDTNHPIFLVHDSPNVRDIDLKIYRRIFNFIIQLEKDLIKELDEVSFQYIITTIDIPNELKGTDFVRLTLDNTGERGKLFGFTY